MRGTRYHGYAAKKHKGKGSHGGIGMAGTGKRADQKKSYIVKYEKDYFGGRKLKCKRKKLKVVNLKDLQELVKKTGKNEISLKNYKILSGGELKEKIIINAKSFSSKAKEKIEKAGGKANVI